MVSYAFGLMGCAYGYQAGNFGVEVMMVRLWVNRQLSYL